MTLTQNTNICRLFLPGLLALLLPGLAYAGPEPATEVELVNLETETVVAAVELEPVAATELADEVLAGLDSLSLPGGSLTLATALDRALSDHPGLRGLEKEYWALDSVAWQEGRKPNPELELEFEEFGGTGDAKGIRALATSLTYTQPIERGGKRGKREIAASLEREVVLWDMAELEHEIQAGVREAYAAAQSAQFELRQLELLRELVKRTYDTVAINVEAGRSARLELERLDIEVALLELEIASAERGLAQAYLELATTWGSTEVDFPAVTPASGADDIPALLSLWPLLENHPAVGRYDAEYQALCALVDLENANGVPDMALFGGVTRLNEAEETVFKIGVAWDLPLHDKNEGNISAAGYHLEQVEDNRAAATLALETELASLHQLAQSAQYNYEAYSASLLPAANEALTLTEEGYLYGKFELLDVLDAQRTVLELESEQTAALLQLHQQLAAIEALLNTNLAELPEPNLAIEADKTEAAPTEEYDHE